MPNAQFFRGDADNMVDRLVEACQRREAPASPLVERELQPCDAAWCGGDDSSYACLAPSLLNQPLEAPRGRNNAYNKHARNGGSPHKGSPSAAGASAAKRARPAVPRLSSDGFACPSFAAAPKPEALPMPTTSLLTRALCRSRSPSPPKAHPAAMAITA